MARPCLTTTDAATIAQVTRQAILKAEGAGHLEKAATARGATYYDLESVLDYATRRGITLGKGDLYRVAEIARLRGQTLGSLSERRRLTRETRLAEDGIGKMLASMGRETTIQVVEGDCREILKAMPTGSINCVVTSPPYFGLRDYKHPSQIGQESKPQAFVSALVKVFREVRRVLADNGTLWLNLGDSYDKAKRLQGIPWRVALALQDDGWILRQDIVWAKPAPVPESVKDRCTRAHEFVFMLSKSERYYYDWQAIATPHTDVTMRRWGSGGESTNKGRTKYAKSGRETSVGNLRNGTNPIRAGGANRKSVWTVPGDASQVAHLAPMPIALAELCILAGCPEDGTVLDPFGGSGTTGLAAQRIGRNAILCELNGEYARLARERIG